MKADLNARKPPTLDIYCLEDGSIFFPMANGRSPKLTYGTKGTNGYMKVGIHGKTYSVHRLIAEAFIQNKDNKPTVDHLNRDKSDNRVCNLRWATHREQRDNSAQVIEAKDYGARSCEDIKSYKQNYMKEYMNRPGKKEHKQAYDRARYEAKKNKRLSNES